MVNNSSQSFPLKTLIADLKHYKKIHGLHPQITDEEMAQLQIGMPIQKIVGFINFDNLKISVHEKVLIPRYETQEVVNKAIPLLSPNSRVLDLGCGSGYIGLTIKQKLGCDVTLSDIDINAIRQTQYNAQINNLQVKIVQSNMFDNIDGKFDCIISNPPYIPRNTKLTSSVVNFEPEFALFGGHDGNDYYRIIIDKVLQYLNPQGLIIVEMSLDNYDFLVANGFKIYNDINHKPRIAIKKI